MSKDTGPPYVFREWITPEQAAEFLARNIARNRTIRMARVREWIDAIEQGKWMVTHQPIAITRDNELLDGQHRLTACVMSNKAIESLIAYDCDPETYMVIDNGLVRSARDTLDESNRVIALARSLIRLTKMRSHSSGISALMVKEVLEWAGPLLREVDKAIGGGSRQATAPIITAAVIHKMAGREEAFTAFLAYHRLDTGALPASALSLLNRLMTRGARHDNFDVMARAYRAFNPKHWDSRKLILTDVSEVLDEMCRAIERYRASLIGGKVAAANDAGAAYPRAAMATE